MNRMSSVQRGLVLATLPMFLLLLLACGGGGQLIAGRAPRWACPSPTPRPWGPSGPVKRYVDGEPLPTITPEGPIAYEQVPEYYQEWEQEYPTPGLAVYPSPTPYGMVGTNYTFGQRVELWPLHVQVSARAGAVLNEPGMPANSMRLYFIDVAWWNHSAETLLFDLATQAQIRSIVAPTGAILTSEGWGINQLAVDRAGGRWPAQSIPPGQSQMRIPIIAPSGEAKSVALVLPSQPDYAPVMPTSTAAPGRPTATPVPTVRPVTPTRNTELQDPEGARLTVFWSKADLAGPECHDPGAMTNWASDGTGREAPISIPAPAGADRVVQIALNQVGKPYVWGAKGPEQFDCSGLMTWSYARIGITIPQGTSGQWPGMRPVRSGELQAGDLIFFDSALVGRVSHVGMLAGDLNGDGRWDMVHASAPCCGVRVEYSVLESSYWQPRMVGFRTAR